MLIAFVGSVFSPYYAWRRGRRGAAAAPAEAHCALNLSLYTMSPGAAQAQRHWCMTERGAAQLQRGPEQLRIGPSRLRWEADALVVELQEWTAPWPRRVAGRLRLQAPSWPAHRFELDANGRHRWMPLAPCARLEVALSSPAWHWTGSAYLDHNQGDVPLAQDFRHWQWQRGPGPEGPGCRIAYTAQPRQGPLRSLHLLADPAGGLSALPALQPQALRRSAWGLPRAAQGLSSADAVPGLCTLESGPFYVRSLLDEGKGRCSVHESLSLERFERPWVQALLPFRMPRRSG